MHRRHIRYTTIQNWSNNVYNLVTKRAVAHEDAMVEWVDGNLGCKLTMKYPSIYLMGEGAHGEISRWLSRARASTRTPAPRSIHAAPTPPPDHHQQVDQQGRRAAPLPGPVKVYPGPTAANPASLRRSAPGRERAQ